MTLNDLSSPFSLLATRRSGKPRDMIAPGPDAEQLRRILTVAARVPDHGKLGPWRFVIVRADQRDAFAARIVEAYRAEKPGAGRLEIEAMEQFARQAPVLVVALFSPRESHIPQWEQQLSAGAACMNALHAATALGFVAGWLTGWAAYSGAVRDILGEAPEQIAAFLFMGTASKELEERPRRDLAVIVSEWQG